MNAKIILFIYFVGVTQAVLIDTSKHPNMNINGDHDSWQMTTVYHPPHSKVFSYKYEPYAYPKYEFEYSVSDKKTGDHKHHQESRDGDRVHGEYSLVESDGSLRKVQYHADDHNGFNAVVSKTVNKHGDHAISITDHTRFFYPIGRGIKINHYFPGNNYHIQNPEKTTSENESKPVHEEKELSNTKVKDESNDVGSESKVTLTEPLKVEDQPKEVILSPKPQILTAVPLNVVPAVVSMINIDNNNKAELMPENSINMSSSPTVEDPSPSLAEDQKADKEDKSSDSDVASSYYHSKIYYISY